MNVHSVTDATPESLRPRDGRGSHRAPTGRRRWIAVAATTAVLAMAGTGLALAELPVAGDSQPVGVAADSSSPAEPAGTSGPASADTRTQPPEPAPSSEKSTSETAEPDSSSTTQDQAGDAFTELRSQAVEIVNAERSAAGCGAVTVADALVAASNGHSQDMADNGYFDHTSEDGRSFSDRAAAEGYHSAIGENIAAGQTDAESVMDSWMNSEGHRANILNCDASQIGLGVAEAADGTLYWTQLFGAG